MMQRALQDLLRKRMDRAIATVLSAKEQNVDCLLPKGEEAASKHLRKVVLDQFNGFYEVCLDVMDSLDNGEVVLNEEYLRKIDAIHQTIAQKAATGIYLTEWTAETNGDG